MDRYYSPERSSSFKENSHRLSKSKKGQKNLQGLMKSSNSDEQNIGVDVSLEETDMYETGQIVSDPYIDKEFQSLDDSFKFYLVYAHRTDFSMRRGRMTRSRKDKSIIGQEFLCSKQEFHSKKDLERNKS
ncbi:hypothetical protein BC332_01534 [Capsicum chinense]|nr:hypothetical protein BC332_01534 [Capsicum chinense]